MKLGLYTTDNYVNLFLILLILLEKRDVYKKSSKSLPYLGIPLFTPPIFPKTGS